MPRIRYVVYGTVQGSQTWSIGLSQFWTLDPPTPPGLNTMAETVFAAFKTNVWSNATSPLAAQNLVATTVQGCRAYHYRGVGLADAGGISSSAQAVGSASSSVMPPQVALVASLLTGVPGRKNRGRIYLPIGSVGLGTDQQLAQAFLTNLAANVAAWINAVNAQSVGGSSGAVAVIGDDDAGFPVTSVKVDSMLDIQRRRRDKIAATRAGVHSVP